MFIFLFFVIAALDAKFVFIPDDQIRWLDMVCHYMLKEILRPVFGKDHYRRELSLQILDMREDAKEDHTEG